jgi:hypothetical protein
VTWTPGCGVRAAGRWGLVCIARRRREGRDDERVCCPCERGAMLVGLDGLLFSGRFGCRAAVEGV